MKRTQLNAILDALALVLLLGLASTGLVLRYQLPPGSGSEFGRGLGRGSLQRPVELLWGLTRHEWGDYHYWIALALLAALSVHILLHWKWIVGVVRGQRSEASGWRLAVGVLALVVISFAASLPFLVQTETTTRYELQQRGDNATTGEFIR